MMSMSDVLIRKTSKRLVKPLSIMVDGTYKELYDRLSADGVKVAEHMRLVIYPELERLLKLSKAG